MDEQTELRLVEDLGYIRATLDDLVRDLSAHVGRDERIHETLEGRLRKLENGRNYLAGAVAAVLVIFTDIRDFVLGLFR